MRSFRTGPGRSRRSPPGFAASVGACGRPPQARPAASAPHRSGLGRVAPRSAMGRGRRTADGRARSRRHLPGSPPPAPNMWRRPAARRAAPAARPASRMARCWWASRRSTSLLRHPPGPLGMAPPGAGARARSVHEHQVGLPPEVVHPLPCGPEPAHLRHHVGALQAGRHGLEPAIVDVAGHQPRAGRGVRSGAHGGAQRQGLAAAPGAIVHHRLAGPCAGQGGGDLAGLVLHLDPAAGEGAQPASHRGRARPAVSGPARSTACASAPARRS